jgi:hypothetical protein
VVVGIDVPVVLVDGRVLVDGVVPVVLVEVGGLLDVEPVVVAVGGCPGRGG